VCRLPAVRTCHDEPPTEEYRAPSERREQQTESHPEDTCDAIQSSGQNDAEEEGEMTSCGYANPPTARRLSQ